MHQDHSPHTEYYTCGFCHHKKAFTEKRGLDIHRKGDLVCSNCRKPFAQRHTLNIHSRKHDKRSKQQGISFILTSSNAGRKFQDSVYSWQLSSGLEGTTTNLYKKPTTMTFTYRNRLFCTFPASLCERELWTTLPIKTGYFSRISKGRIRMSHRPSWPHNPILYDKPGKVLWFGWAT